MEAGEKIISIFVSEFAEALLFICVLLFMGAIPDYAGKDSITGFVISAWVLLGIGTPFIIWLEMWDIFKGGLK
jgi:hypothetical protein